MTLYEMIERPRLDAPVLILAMDGWIDAGLAAAGAVEMLGEQLDTITVARFETDALLDYRARRPISHLVDGVLRGLTWPSLEIRAASDEQGREMLLLVGSEPDRQWLQFTDEVVALAVDFGVRMCVGLGAYQFAAPHTRPPRVACTASTASLADRGFLRGSLDFPGGIQAAIEQACDARGIPSIGLWAQVPHYVPTVMPFPAGSIALLETLARVADLELPLGDLPSRADATRERLNELMEQNPQHVAMLHQLEEAWDSSEPAETDTAMGLSDLVTGDELAAELEQFLRDQRGQG
jgi:predicted ATP-grasp superfamily ATP-dependent carboligase